MEVKDGITCFIALLLLFACDDDDREKSDMQAYCTYNGVTNLMSSGDLLTMVVTDTLVVEIEGGIPVEGSAHGNYVVVSSDGLNVKTSDSDNATYLITCNQTGSSRLAIEDGSGDPHLMLNIEVENRVLNYIVNVPYTDIDIDDETLKEEIETEVNETLLFPSSEYLLEYLSYDYPKKGLLGMVYPEFLNSRDTITGTFQEKIVSNDTLFIMEYDNRTIEYLYEKDTSERNYARLTEDLTEVYQEKYPDRSINKVHAITPVHIVRLN